MTALFWREYFGINGYNINEGNARILILAASLASGMIWGNLLNLFSFSPLDIYKTLRIAPYLFIDVLKCIIVFFCYFPSLLPVASETLKPSVITWDIIGTSVLRYPSD